MPESAAQALAAERTWSATGAPPDVPDPTHNPGVLLARPTLSTTRSVLAAELVRGDVLPDGSSVTLSAAVTNNQAVFEVDWSTVRYLDADASVIINRKEYP